MAPKKAQATKDDSKKASSKTPKKSKKEKSADNEIEYKTEAELAKERSEVDLEELEEQEEAAAAAKASASNTPNLTETVVSASKNFRQHPDMENFYRFIYENDLRFEALSIIDDLLVTKKYKK